MRSSVSKLMMAVMLAAVTAGCFHATVTTGLRPSGETVEDKWADSFISGLVPPGTVAAGPICGEGRIARVDTRVSFLNQFVSFLTLGIYSPMEIVVTCAVPAQGGIRGPEMQMADEPERQSIRSAFTASWSTTSFADETLGARSQAVSPVTPMGSPYRDVTGTIFVQCLGPAWIRFSVAPNLTDGAVIATGDGYTNYTLSANIDGRDARYSVSQDWGDYDLRFHNTATVRQALIGSNEIEILIPWSGEGNVRFRWDLGGSSSAIQSACG